MQTGNGRPAFLAMPGSAAVFPMRGSSEAKAEVERGAHNAAVAGSSPAPATTFQLYLTVRDGQLFNAAGERVLFTYTSLPLAHVPAGGPTPLSGSPEARP